MNEKANLRLGILYMLTSVVALGFMPSLVRKIYEASELTALQVSVWRFVLAAPMLWLFTKLNHRDVHPFSRRSRALLGRAGTVGIFYGLAVVAFFSSLERIPVPVFILIFYSYPIVVAVLSRVLGERLTGMFWPERAHRPVVGRCSPWAPCLVARRCAPHWRSSTSPLGFISSSFIPTRRWSP